MIHTQWHAHERLKDSGTICPFVFHRDGAPIRELKKAWHRACAAAGYPL